MRRVVVTGIGLVTPAGRTASEFFASLCSGRSAIAHLEGFETPQTKKRIGAVVAHLEDATFLNGRDADRLDRATQLALVASRLALEDARLLQDADINDGNEIGVAVGTAAGCVQVVERYHCRYFSSGRTDVFAIPNGMNHAAAAQISIRHGLRGFNVTVSTACSSGATAIGMAFNEIRFGNTTRMLAGGTDAPITKPQLEAWSAMRTLSSDVGDPPRAMKPFSKGRDGFALGEGAALLVLEELTSAKERGAGIYAEVVGFGSTSDGRHITSPAVEGQAAALRKALADGGLAPEAIGYVNAHGTATIQNDRTETAAIKNVFGRRPIPVSSIKPITGHMLGASGAAEFIAAILAAREGIVPPTINYSEPDPECDLDYVVEGARRANLEYVLSTSFAFGGHNAVLIAKRWD